jgi:hypothetical protein
MTALLRKRIRCRVQRRGNGCLEETLSTLLEWLLVHSSDDIVHVLRYCTLIQSFTIIDEPSRLDAEVFIDLDSDTGSLKPWRCEATLKELKIRITGIPSPARKVDSLFEKVLLVKDSRYKINCMLDLHDWSTWKHCG